MTREAAREGFERFVGDAIDYTAEEFSVARALKRGRRGPDGAVVDRLLEADVLWDEVVQPELDAYRERVLGQFEVVLDYAAGDEPIDAYRKALIDRDTYAESLREDLSPARREAVLDAAVANQRELGDAVAPLVASEASEFWPALLDAYDRETAEAVLTEQFTFTDLLREERDAFRMATTVDPGEALGGLGGLFGGLPTVEVEYTDEALRAMRRAERRVVEEATRELRSRG